MKEIQIGTHLIDRLRACEQRGDTDTANCIIAGIKGELSFRKHLRKLVGNKGQGWAACYDVPVGHGDIDCILATPSGLHAFEIKNHHGVLVRDENGWKQVKAGAKGKPYLGSLRNPSGQLLAAVRSLKAYLATHGIRGIWVHAVVVFTHPAARLIVRQDSTSSVRVITLAELGDVVQPESVSGETQRVQNVIAQLERLREAA